MAGLIKKAIQHLLRSGYFKKAGKNKYFLTTKALGKILELRIKRKIKDKKKLKKQYLVLIFDIPEERRKTRNLFRHQLKELGFEMIQKSVWITQQDILREMKALIEFCELGEEVKFFIAEKA